MTYSPGASADDWTADSSATAFSSTGALKMGRDFPSGNYAPGVRFLSLPLLRLGIETITGVCKVTFKASGNFPEDGICAMRIYGQLASNPVNPTSYAQAVALTKTTAFVNWIVPGLTSGTDYDTPDLASIFQEMMTAGFFNVAGNACTLLFAFGDDIELFSLREFGSMDVGTAPILTLPFSTPSTGSNSVCLKGCA